MASSNGETSSHRSEALRLHMDYRAPCTTVTGDNNNNNNGPLTFTLTVSRTPGMTSNLNCGPSTTVGEDIQDHSRAAMHTLRRAATIPASRVELPKTSTRLPGGGKDPRSRTPLRRSGPLGPVKKNKNAKQKTPETESDSAKATAKARPSTSPIDDAEIWDFERYRKNGISGLE